MLEQLLGQVVVGQDHKGMVDSAVHNQGTCIFWSCATVLTTPSGKVMWTKLAHKKEGIQLQVVHTQLDQMFCINKKMNAKLNTLNNTMNTLYAIDVFLDICMHYSCMFQT